MLITTARIELTRAGYNVRELNGFLYADDDCMEIVSMYLEGPRVYERHVDRNWVNRLLGLKS